MNWPRRLALMSMLVGALAASPCRAVEPAQSIVNLDLCMLSYQLYHQSLCLPLDPWYDITARPGTDRRTNICKYTYEFAKTLGAEKADGQNPVRGYFSGPSAARGWTGVGEGLDPIVTNYKQINPKLPMFTRDGEKFLAANAPAYITGTIKTVQGCRYLKKPADYGGASITGNAEIFDIADYPTGTDHLIVFEGGTGVVDRSDPAWSMMGFVLYRKTAAGYDLHVVFRGSRSGAALFRTISQAAPLVFGPRGNADWVTDLGVGKQIVDDNLSKYGSLAEGFSKSLTTMFGTIASSCKKLGDLYGPPNNITVTGHSLGAALASQFASAVLLKGKYGQELANTLKTWPWQKTTLFAYAEPLPGNPAWAAAFNTVALDSQHYWVAGDTVISGPAAASAVKVIDAGMLCGRSSKLAKPDGCTKVDNAHETYVIRAAILGDMTKYGVALPPEMLTASTWGHYDTFTDMLAGAAKNYQYPGAAPAKIVTAENVRSVLVGCRLGLNFERWLEDVYVKMLADTTSYRMIKFTSTLEQRKKQVRDAVAQMRSLTKESDKKQTLDRLEADLKFVKEQLGSEAEENFICLAMILNTFQKTTLTLADLDTRPEVKKILASKLK